MITRVNATVGEREAGAWRVREKWKEREKGNGNAGELLKASPCDKRKKCFRLLLIFLNNRTTPPRFVSGHRNTAPDK